ncbi:MAG: hypothetical protein ACRET3_02160 [Burkholderiales bacterium]
MYLLNFVWLGLSVWPAVIHPAKPFTPLDGVAVSFWAALSTLCGLGLRYPLKMLPLLLLQLLYKSVWLLAVALPLWSAGPLDALATDLTKTFVAGVIADLLVIPWAYVLAHYVKTPGDRWTFRSPLAAPPVPTGTGGGGG